MKETAAMILADCTNFYLDRVTHSRGF